MISRCNCHRAKERNFSNLIRTHEFASPVILWYKMFCRKVSNNYETICFCGDGGEASHCLSPSFSIRFQLESYSLVDSSLHCIDRLPVISHTEVN